MMDPGPGGGARRGKRRRRSASNGGGTAERSSTTNRKRRRRRRDGHGPTSSRSQELLPPAVGGDESSILGARVVRERRTRQTDGPPDAFGLFCSYFLGVTPDDGYQKPSIEEIARRHGMTPEEIKGLLVEFDLEPNTVRQACDLEGALLDIRLAPAGISRTEIARDIYEEYLAARTGSI